MQDAVTAPRVTHAEYDFSVLFVAPARLAENREVVGAEAWFHEPAMPYRLRIRECRLDEFSDYGFLIESPGEGVEAGPMRGRTFGLLLDDALADTEKFVEMLSELPADWNFGGLVAVDRRTQLAFNTNCDVAETPEWYRILRASSSQETVEVTFSLTDVGVRIERREGDMLMQQMAWEVPPEWGPHGSHHYPVHRFLNGTRCQRKLLQVLESYGEVCQELRQRDAAQRVIRRLGVAGSA